MKPFEVIDLTSSEPIEIIPAIGPVSSSPETVDPVRASSSSASSSAAASTQSQPQHQSTRKRQRRCETTIDLEMTASQPNEPVVIELISDSEVSPRSTIPHRGTGSSIAITPADRNRNRSSSSVHSAAREPVRQQASPESGRLNGTLFRAATSARNQSPVKKRSPSKRTTASFPSHTAAAVTTAAATLSTSQAAAVGSITAEISGRTLNLASSSKKKSLGECTICLDEMKNMTATPCGHVFCNSCIVDWLNRHSICPVCRKKVKRKQVYRLYV